MRHGALVSPRQVQRIEYTDAAGGALHWKIHHAIGDGISLASLLLGFVDGGMPEMPGDSARSTAAPVPRSLLARLAHTGARAAAFAYNTAVALSRATYLLFVPDLPSAVRAQGVLYRKWAKRRIALSPEVPPSPSPPSFSVMFSSIHTGSLVPPVCLSA